MRTFMQRKVSKPTAEYLKMLNCATDATLPSFMEPGKSSAQRFATRPIPSADTLVKSAVVKTVAAVPINKQLLNLTAAISVL